MNTQLFMQYLTVSALLNCGYHDVFGCHEWQLSHHSLMDNLWINYQTITDVEHDVEDGITPRNASATEILLFAESSKVLSNTEYLR